jgi:two-component system, NtrC family, response regulator AtoC
MPELEIFVVEDDEWYAEFISYTLSLDQDIHVTKFLNGNDCIKNLKSRPDVVTIDYRLPDMSGETLLKTIKDLDQEIEIVVISEQEKIEIAVELLKLGAYDYIVKSMDIRERLLNVVRNLKKQSNLKKQLVTLQNEVERKYDFEKQIIGQSKPIKKIFSLIEKAINTSISVTITGETGTGKDLVAKAIHYNSERRKKPFVAINMAAIPRELVESELFGHEKGAFTGAHASRKGKFEEADGGTLFLDEIGEMDLTLQAKLLRALQEREVTPVGSNKSIQVNCRILVATNKNLLQNVRSGMFRDDLYYRLFGLGINMPPLRERDNDILLLAKHFMKVYCQENNIPEKIISREAQKKLMTYTYPGNVRELKSVIELSVVLSNNQQIEVEDINFSEDDTLPEMINRELTLREHNLRIVKSYLNKYDGNVKEAARKLDIGFSTIYRMLKEEEEQLKI